MVAKRLGLYAVTAAAEILGCYFPYLWLREQKTPFLLVPAAVSLAMFAWLLTLHPAGAGRTYAAYGGVYIVAALLWSWAVDRQSPTRWDLIGGLVCLLGATIIVAGAPAGPAE
jgi:small multidrug resistance family-3 protein